MAASPSPSAISDEPSDGSLFQNSVYIGINIQNILYGIELVLYYKTMRILLGRSGVHEKVNLFYALFSSMMVLLITVWIATQAIFGEKMWLIDDDYPGGHDAYLVKNLSVWYMDWGTTAVILMQLMTDGLMIYRCRVIWNSYRAVVAPIFLWFSTLVLGVAVDWTSSVPGGNFFVGLTAQLVLAYYTVSVVLNATLTCMICYRMVWYGRRVREHLGREYASLYFNVISLVVESVLPYTLSGVAFLVSLGVGSSTSVAFLCVYMLMMCISPQVLILRVIAGRSWNNDTYLRPGSAVLFNNSTWESKQIDSRGPGVHLQALAKVYIPGGQERNKVARSTV